MNETFNLKYLKISTDVILNEVKNLFHIHKDSLSLSLGTQHDAPLINPLLCF